MIIMLEEKRQRKAELQIDIENRIKQINDLNSQVITAQNTIRQWQDSLLLVRGQMIEVDAEISQYELAISISKEEDDVDEE